MRKPRIRILVASGARARWVEKAAGHGDLVTLGEFKADVLHARHGPPGVTFESGPGNLRHGIGEPKEADRRRDAFAHKIAEALNQQDTRGEFDRLGLIAPVRLLRAVRKQLSDGVKAKVGFELPKDLTKHPNHELTAWIDHPEFG